MEQLEALVAAADKLLSCSGSLFQTEIKEEKTQKLDTVAFCYLTFTSGPLSLWLLSSKAPAKITGPGEGVGGHSLLCGKNIENSTKMLDQGEGVEKRAERGRKKGPVQWVTSLHHHPRPHCFFRASTHDISPLQRNGIFQFQMSAKEKGLRLKFSFNGRPGKKKKEAASRLGTPLLAFFLPLLHSSLSGSQDTRPAAAADFPQPAACCCRARFDGSPAVPKLASSSPSGSYFFGLSLGCP